MARIGDRHDPRDVAVGDVAHVVERRRLAGDAVVAGPGPAGDLVHLVADGRHGVDGGVAAR